MRDLPIACPAATRIDPPNAGAMQGGPTIICGVLARANREAADDYKSANRGDVNPTFRAEAPPVVDGGLNQVEAHCAGTGIPGGACSYTACSLWQGDKHDVWKAQRRRGGVVLDGPKERTPRPRPEFQEA